MSGNGGNIAGANGDNDDGRLRHNEEIEDEVEEAASDEELEEDNLASYPSAEYYQPPNGLELRSVPFRHTEGLGIRLYSGDDFEEVFALENNDTFHFVEHMNTYGLSVTAQIAVIVRANADARPAGPNGGLPSVQPVFDDFMKREIARLIALRRFRTDPDRAVANRQQLDFLWRVWSGFNSINDHNEILRNITVRYAKIRTGRRKDPM